MSNITLSVPDDLLKESRQYAQKHNTSLNALVRNLLEKIISRKKKGLLKSSFDAVDRSPVSSKGKKWTRDELYDI